MVHIVVTVLRGGVPKSKLPCRDSTVTTYKVNCKELKLFYLLSIYFSYMYASFSIVMGERCVGLFIQPL